MATNAANLTKTMTNTEDRGELVSLFGMHQVDCRVTKDADCANEVRSRLAIGMT